MKRIIESILLLLVIILIACENDDIASNPLATQPKITSITPDGAHAGETLTVYGLNLTKDMKIVFNDDVYAEVTGFNDEKDTVMLTVKVPGGTLDGPLSVRSGQNTYPSEIEFNTMPLVKSILDAGEDIILIEGDGFGNNKDEVTVIIDYLPTEILELTPEAIKVKSSASSEREYVLVIAGADTAIYVGEGAFAGAAILECTPNTAKTGQEVTLTCKNIPGPEISTAVKLNDVHLPIVDVVREDTLQYITVSIPGEAKTGSLSLEILEQTIESDVKLTIEEFKILDFSPKLGLPGTNVKIYLNDYDFDCSYKIYIGAKEATELSYNIEDSEQCLYCDVSTGTKNGPVKIILSSGVTIESADEFEISDIKYSNTTVRLENVMINQRCQFFDTQSMVYEDFRDTSYNILYEPINNNKEYGYKRYDDYRVDDITISGDTIIHTLVHRYYYAYDEIYERKYYAIVMNQQQPMIDYIYVSKYVRNSSGECGGDDKTQNDFFEAESIPCKYNAGAYTVYLYEDDAINAIKELYSTTSYDYNGHYPAGASYKLMNIVGAESNTSLFIEIVK